MKQISPTSCSSSINEDIKQMPTSSSRPSVFHKQRLASKCSHLLLVQFPLVHKGVRQTWNSLPFVLVQFPLVHKGIRQTLNTLLFFLFNFLLYTKVSSKHLALLLVQFPFAHHEGIRQIPCSSFCSTSFEKFTISSKYVYLCCSSGRAIVVVD
jgi:hypothetical protein